MGAKSSKGATVLKGPGSTTQLSVHVHEGSKGICQDSVLAVESILPEYRAAVMGVFDGHGHSGHHVSEFVRDQVMEQLRGALDEIETKPRTVGSWTGVLDKVFTSVDDMLHKDQTFSAESSGSTAVMAVRKSDILVVAHVGDSRCVLGKTMTINVDTNPTYKITSEQLTRDHKAGDPVEKARIQKAGGQVMRWMNAVDRVFVPGKHEPGLAVARAFGDFDLKGHGLIVNPVVRVHDIQPHDEFVVLCSDGVWDVLSNEEVVNLIWDCKNRSKAAKVVAQKAVEGWNKQRNPNARDDISVVVYFF